MKINISNIPNPNSLKYRNNRKREDILSARSLNEERCYLQSFEPWNSVPCFLAEHHQICIIHSEHSFEANSKAPTALFDLLFGETIVCIVHKCSDFPNGQLQQADLLFFVLDNCLEAYGPCPVPNNFLHSTESQTVPLGNV